MDIMIIFYLVVLLAFGRIVEVAVIAEVEGDPLGCCQEEHHQFVNLKDFVG